MPAWNEDDYVKRAAAVALQSATTKKSLNEVCEKVATEESLNPEEIRTLVRLSNVAMFQHIFKEKDRAGTLDRHVEFDVGDPETVIMRIHQAAIAPTVSANIMNDKLANEVPDMMGAKRRGFEYDLTTVKQASDDAPKPAKREFVVMAMRKLAEEYDSRRMSAGFRWEQKMAAVYDAFRKAPGYGPSFLEFEKDAYSEFGDTVQLELDSLRTDLKIDAPKLAEETRAKLAEFHVASETKELELLKEAADARSAYVAAQEAHAWVLEHMPKVGK